MPCTFTYPRTPLLAHLGKEYPFAVRLEFPKETLHVYLLIGQSNMAGRAQYAEEDAAVIERSCVLRRVVLL